MLKKFSLLRSFTFGIWVTSQFITCILSPAFSAEKFKQNHGVVVILQSPLVASPRISEEIQDDPGTIIGIVREKESRRPVENVQVYIPSLKTGAVSQADGRFALNEVPAGVYTLKIRMLGYERITIDSLVVKAGAKVEIAPELVLKVYEVHEIQVTASRHEALAQSIPQLVSVVSRQKIRDRAISQTPEVLREEMGVVVQKTSNSGGSPIIRGLRANKILLLVDGIRMNNATYRGGNLHYLNTLNPGAIERMEVVHGPSSVLYGSDALGGTINTLTITPPFSVDDKLEFDGAAGTGFSSADETKYLNLHATASGRKWSLFTGFSLYSYGDVRRGSSGGDELMQRLRSSPEDGRNLAKVQKPNAYDSRYANLKFHFQPHEKHKFTLAWETVRQENVPRYDVFERLAYDVYFYHPQHRDLAYLKYENQLNGPLAEKMFLTLSTHSQKEGQIKQRAGSTTRTHDETETNTYGWQVQFNKVIKENHFLIYGTEGYHDRLCTSAYSEEIAADGGEISLRTPVYPDGSAYNGIGFFAQGEWHIRDPWMLTTGVRYSFFHLQAPFGFAEPLHLGLVDRRTSALTASLSSRYALTTNLSWTGNIAQGFRAPNLDDLSKFGPGKGGAFYDVPNPDISSEKALSFDTGIKYNSDDAKMSVVAYYTRLTDALNRQPGIFNGLPYLVEESDTMVVYYKTNTGTAFTTGFEIGMEKLVNWGIWARANMSYVFGKNARLDEPLSAIPPFTGLLALRWNKPKFWIEMNSRYALQQNRLSAEDKLDHRIPIGGTPAWFTINFRSGLNIGSKTKINVALMNMLDLNYREHLSGLNAPGRSAVISAEMQLF